MVYSLVYISLVFCHNDDALPYIITPLDLPDRLACTLKTICPFLSVLDLPACYPAWNLGIERRRPLVCKQHLNEPTDTQAVCEHLD